MDKLKLAHDYAIALINSDCEMQFDKFIQLCWNYADAMKTEAEEREDKTRPEALCEVDWRVAPEWAKYWAIREDSDTALWCINKPTVTGDCFLSHGGCGPAPSFGFTGSHIVERPHGF
jgi:hypothetical protein